MINHRCQTVYWLTDQKSRARPFGVFVVQEPESDYMDAAMITVMQIHLTEPEGDVLLFLTGKRWGGVGVPSLRVRLFRTLAIMCYGSVLQHIMSETLGGAAPVWIACFVPRQQ